ncbi:MAG: Gfo/Idh/MocA family oxidoreductase [Lachnospiraceae bacterium]|nr:Gfo/Idh/MocA family oxidoreductase [Lachnospiraceae bacterium]
MDFMVIGLGSMGRRRIRLIKQLSGEHSAVGVDNNPGRRSQAEEELNIRTFDTIGEAFEEAHPQAAIVSTSPLSHADIIEKCLMLGCHVFTELNLTDDRYGSNIRLAKDKNLVLFLSSTFLYREEIRYIRERTGQMQGRLNYYYHVGQYLPDWHPWESIKDYFVGDKRTNGCREIFAIELPWLVKVFGDIISYRVMSSKNTDLPIDYNDNYMLLTEHSGGNKGVLMVDVVSRKPVRNLEIFGENLFISWDGSPKGLYEYDIEEKKDKNIDIYDSVDKLDGYAVFVIENDYLNELKAFIGTIEGTAEPEYTFEEDEGILKMIDKIEAGEDL